MRVDVEFKDLVNNLRKQRVMKGIDLDPQRDRRLTRAIANAIRENKIICDRLIMSKLEKERLHKENLGLNII